MPCFLSSLVFPLLPAESTWQKLDMRSGMERLTYALIIVLVATMSAWIMAMLLHLQPVDFIEIPYMPVAMWILTRLIASFFGVFGFSIMFNSPVRLACSAGGAWGGCKYPAAGACGSCRLTSGSDRIYRSSDSRASGLPSEK